jgi:hypothetical protein
VLEYAADNNTFQLVEQITQRGRKARVKEIEQLMLQNSMD